MAKVTGFGGLFYKVSDPVATRAWYERHLGIGGPWGTMFRFGDEDPDGVALLTPFDASSEKFAPSTLPFMINLRVDDLEAIVARLEAAGIAILDRQAGEHGKFAWLVDPDGVKLELWQP